MQRLVYSPKAFVYVQTDQSRANNNGVINLSEYVVSGNVTRKINQVSTAEIVIRNPDRQFTKPGAPTFRPMDKIMIWLQRLPGCPVQVFTGYLDSTPYYQMYPGTCSLSASCTLKRLQYTWFDAGLPFMRYFMAKYGWDYNPETGALITTGDHDAYGPGLSGGPPPVVTVDPNAEEPVGFSFDGRFGAAADSTSTGDGEGIFVVGDSLGVGAVPFIKDSFKKKTVESNVQAGRGSSAGASVLESRPKLPRTIVVLLGTNDDPTNTSGFRDNVKRIVKKAAGRNVIWVNLYGKDRDFRGLNRILADEASKNPNLTVVDWYSRASKDPKLLADNVHPKNLRSFAQPIESAIASAGERDDSEGNRDGRPVIDVRRDSSFANLLYATLKHIGGWTPAQIHIDTLPPGLIDRVLETFEVLQEGHKEAREHHDKFLKKLIGEGSYGDGGASDTNVSGIRLGGLDAEQNKTLDTILSVGRARSEPRHFLLAAVATGLVEDNLHNSASERDHDSQGWRQERRSVYAAEWAKSPKGSLDVAASAKRFYEECVTDGKGEKNPGVLAQKVQGSAHPSRYSERMPDAESLLRQWEDKADGKNNDQEPDPIRDAADSDANNNAGTQEKPGGKKKDRGGASSDDGKAAYPLSKKASNLGGVAAHNSRALGNWQSDNAIDLGVPAGTKWIAVEDGVISTSLGYGDSSGGGATIYGHRLHLEGESGVTYFYQHGGPNMAPRGKRVKKGDVIGEVGDYGSNGIPVHLHFAADKANPETIVEGHIVIGDDARGGGADSDGDSGGPQDALQAAKAASWITNFQIEGIVNMAEALALPPDKSLMNDSPLLPFVEQLCQGSVRNFMSMPDGHFYAFFPDYFGGFGKKPYWSIDDIEILEGNIQLTDDNLATHVYVVGDTLGEGAEGFGTRLASTGVATVMNMGLIDFINNDPKSAKQKNQDKNKGKAKGKSDKGDEEEEDLPPFLGSVEESLAFLRRYGARPIVQNAPYIRSNFFETFYAFQTFMLMWSRQFLTTFSFTFMPEVYPGGIVAFEQHGIQCYVEEVRHDWDYTGGFTTQANLTAPAAISSSKNEISKGLVVGGVVSTPDPDRPSVTPSP